jgi:hypothetical protein
MKKVFLITLIFCLIFSFTASVYAEDVIEAKDSEINYLLNVDITEMTKDELNSYITQIAEFCQTSNTEEVNPYSTNTEVPGIVGQAWLAAAEIARGEGYECAAIAVEYSVKNVNLTESTHPKYGDGPFLRKLKTTDAYQTYLNSLLESGKDKVKGSFEITKKDNSDLFYALHNVTTSASGTFVGTSMATYIICITDVFDFAFDNDYDSLFTTLVNDWAWLCQQTDVLHPIDITLTTAGRY